jgi:hypothetical protein
MVAVHLESGTDAGLKLLQEMRLLYLMRRRDLI